MPVEGSILGVLGELFSPENRRDPHPLYHQLRAEAPMAYSDEMDEWVLTRWADCEAVLRDPRWSSAPEHRPVASEGFTSISAEASDVGMKTLLFLDPPDHTRLRRLVSKAFTPRRVEQLRSHVTEIADSLLAGVEPRRPFDVIATLAYPLPVIVICELLGVPVDDRHQ